MGEVVTLHVGQCGNNIGKVLWQQIAEEHGIDLYGRRTDHGGKLSSSPTLAPTARKSVPSPRQRSSSSTTTRESSVFDPSLHIHDHCESFFLHNMDNDRYIPRAILIDSDASSLNNLQASKYGMLFNPDNFICGNESTGNNWAKGYYGFGNEMGEDIMDKISTEVEKCDTLAALEMFHSMGGGTGAGLGSYIVSRLLYDEYRSSIRTTYSLTPSAVHSDVVLEPYNALLSMHNLVEYTDFAVLFSNTALFDISSALLQHPSPGFDNFNELIARCACHLTSGMRFPGPDSCGMRKLASATVPFPRLHLLMPSLAPLRPTLYENYSVRSVLNQLFHPRYSLCRMHSTPMIHPVKSSMDVTEGNTFISGACIFRGEAGVSEIEAEVERYTRQHMHSFIDYIPNSVMVSHTAKPGQDASLSAVLLSNSSGMIDVVHSLTYKVQVMLKRKAYLHWFTEEGMEESELIEALQNLEDLIVEYQRCSDVAAETADIETKEARKERHRERIKAPWHEEPSAPYQHDHRVPMKENELI